MDVQNFSTLVIISAVTVGLFIRQLTKRSDSEAFDPLGIDYKDAPQKKRNRSSEAIRKMETESPYQYDVPSMESKPAYKYDVFLSFCGADTRLSFTDFLYKRIKDAGISVFLDSEELKCGQKIKEIFKAVDESQIYIPIFSKKFASRIWCLREVERMERRHSESQLSHRKREIFPIFYDVDADDVKLRTGSYKHDMRRLEKYCRPGEPERWSIALKAVGGIIGRELKGKRQGEEIDSIVIDVLRKYYNGKHVDMPRDLVEDHRQIKEIIEKLDLNSSGVRFIRIHGTGGIGKTTLAKFVFKKLSPHFERVCFVNDVRKSSERELHGLLTLQKRLLTDIDSPMLADQINNVEEGKYRIEAVCKTRKVLLVLDNLNKEEQLEKLAKEANWFGPGSRIIITTRSPIIGNTICQQSNEVGPNQAEEIVDYNVRTMELGQALQLFRKKAFRGNSPTEDCNDLSEKIVRKVDMLPLALEVIGSYLYDLGLALTPYGVTKTLLEETLKKLNEEGPFEEVQNVLMISCEGLKGNEKEVFLDIACFFTNEDRTYPDIMWKACGYQLDSIIGALCLRSLIKIIDSKFWMHDQVQDLGRSIVRLGYPRKFSRLWTHMEAEELLERKERNEDVEALSLTSGDQSHIFTDAELRALPKLRLLRAKGKGSSFSGDFNHLLPNLIWLSWQKWEAHFEAENFHFSRLVVLNLSHSDIEDGWDGWSQMKMTKLKVLDLSDCTKLETTPDFSNFTSLETLVLARCPNLMTIHPSISKLQLLETLNIKGCSSLGELPEEVASLQLLKEIVMPQNFQPMKLPKRFGNLISLSSFKLSCHPKICLLPDSIGRATSLTCLNLRECVGIKELPNSIGGLINLLELDVSNSGILKLPDSIGNLDNLKVLSFCRTQIKEIPHTIGGLKKLEGLYAHKSWDLTDKNLEEIGELTRLKELNLAFTSVSRLPPAISPLHLQKLEVGSIELEHVPALPLSLKYLAVQALDISLVPHLSSLTHLKHLELQRISDSTNMPRFTWSNYQSKLQATSLREQLSYQLPSHLSILKLRGICPLPQFSNLKGLTVLHVIDSTITHLPVNPGLTHLRELVIRRCKSLEKIQGLSVLSTLKRLILMGLEKLVEIQGLSELKSLQHLCLSNCDLIEELPNLSKLGELQHLELEACPKLRPIEDIDGLESGVLDARGRTTIDKVLDISRPTWQVKRLPVYDVFMSSKGQDTRHSIVSYLHAGMLLRQISVYSDIDDFRANEGIGEKIQQALASSNIYIPVFSKNYASSHLCLSELAEMVKFVSESNGKRNILPIFYDVEIVDVKLETDLYGRDLYMHQMNFDHNEVESWKKALIEVAAMEGFVSNRNSFEQVLESVIEEVEKARKSLNADS